MAKQKTFDAEGFPEKPSELLQADVDHYVKCLRAKATAQGKLNASKTNLIERMQSEGVDKVRLDGENKFIHLVEEEKIKIETVKKEKDAAE